MALFELPEDPLNLRKVTNALRNSMLAKRLVQDNRPEAEPRKGLFRFMNQMTNKKQQRLFTYNSDTLKRLANTDPITWAIRRTIKGYVNQAGWDIVIDTQDRETELDRYEEYSISHLSPYASGNIGDFRSNLLDKKLVNKIKTEIKHIYDEPVDNTSKKKKIEWYFASVVRQIREEAEMHRTEVKAIFEVPSEQGVECTFRTLQDLLVDDLLIFDTAALVKNYSRTGKLAEMYHIPGDQIRLYRNDDRTIPEAPEPAYVWEEAGMIRAEFTKDEMVFMMQNPQENGYGMSPLEVAAYIITASIFADEYNIDFFKNSNVPPGVFDLGKDVTEDQRLLFQQMWENEVKGRGGLHRMLFTSGTEGAQFIPIQQQSNKDAQMMEYMKWTLAVKTACYGMSGQDIGFVVDYHRTTSETQAGMSQARGVRSVLHLLEQYYNREIVKKEFDFDDVKFEWQDIDTTDEQKEATIDTQDLGTGVISINERRKKLNLKPIDGGDTHTIATPQVLPVSDLETKEEGKEDLEEQTEGADTPQGEQAGEEQDVEGEKPSEEAPEQESAAADITDIDVPPTGKSMNFKVNRKASVEKQQKNIDATIATLKEKGIDGTVKVSFEVPEDDDDKVEK